MTGCDCPHEPVEHGTADLFGTSMCLVPDCDCEGTRAELEAERAMRRNLPKSRLLMLCANYTRDEATACKLANEILAEFNLEAR